MSNETPLDTDQEQAAKEEAAAAINAVEDHLASLTTDEILSSLNATDLAVLETLAQDGGR